MQLGRTSWKAKRPSQMQQPAVCFSCCRKLVSSRNQGGVTGASPLWAMGKAGAELLFLSVGDGGGFVKACSLWHSEVFGTCTNIFGGKLPLATLFFQKMIKKVTQSSEMGHFEYLLWLVVQPVNCIFIFIFLRQTPLLEPRQWELMC